MWLAHIIPLGHSRTALTLTSDWHRGRNLQDQVVGLTPGNKTHLVFSISHLNLSSVDDKLYCWVCTHRPKNGLGLFSQSRDGTWASTRVRLPRAPDRARVGKEGEVLSFTGRSKSKPDLLVIMKTYFSRKGEHIYLIVY